MTTPNRDPEHVHTYMTGVADQITAAVAADDTDGVIGILDRVENDGYPAAARELEAGVRRTHLGPDFDEPQTEEAGTVKPADLKPGYRINTEIGTLVVSTEPWADRVPDAPRWDRVFVDVEVPEPGKFGDAARMLEVTGASEFAWLSMTPKLRYRLAFHPDTDVQTGTHTEERQRRNGQEQP